MELGRPDAGPVGSDKGKSRGEGYKVTLMLNLCLSILSTRKWSEEIGGHFLANSSKQREVRLLEQGVKGVSGWMLECLGTGGNWTGCSVRDVEDDDDDDGIGGGHW